MNRLISFSTVITLSCFIVLTVSSMTCDPKHKPPCPKGWTMYSCQVKTGINETEVNDLTCSMSAKEPEWQYWVIAGIVMLIIIVLIVLYKYTRELPCCVRCKELIRHDKNRVITRWCVKYVCKCQCCIECCEPYTRPTIKEIRAQREHERRVDLSTNYHEYFYNISQLSNNEPDGELAANSDKPVESRRSSANETPIVGSAHGTVASRPENSRSGTVQSLRVKSDTPKDKELMGQSLDHAVADSITFK